MVALAWVALANVGVDALALGAGSWHLERAHGSGSGTWLLLSALALDVEATVVGGRGGMFAPLEIGTSRGIKTEVTRSIHDALVASCRVVKGLTSVLWLS